MRNRIGHLSATDDLQEKSFRCTLEKPAAAPLKAAVDLDPPASRGGGLSPFLGSEPFKDGLPLGSWDGRNDIVPASGTTVPESGGTLKGCLSAGERLILKRPAAQPYGGGEEVAYVTSGRILHAIASRPGDGVGCRRPVEGADE